jgi:WD40 repeat protein
MKTTICNFETHLHKLQYYLCGSVPLLGLGLLLGYVNGYAQQVEAIHIFQGHSDSVESVAFSPDGSKVLSGSHDNTMKLWNVETGTLEQTFQGHSNFIMSVAFASSDGRNILSGSADGSLKHWGKGNDTIFLPLEEPIGLVHSIAFSPDGNYALLSGSRHNTTKLWDVKTGLESITPPTHQAWVHLVAFSSDGNRALSASDDGIIKVWNVEDGKEINSFSNTDRMWATTFVPNRNQLLFGGNDGTIKVLDIATGKEIRTLKGHTGRVYAVAIAGSQVISGGHDGTLKLWDIETEQEIKSFQGHSDIVSSIVFSPNGNYALSGSYDKTLKLWGINNVPTTKFEVLPDSGKAPLNVTLDASKSFGPISGGTLVSYEWVSSNGQKASESTTSMHFDKDGVYTVTLTVTDNQGQTSSKDHTITVADNIIGFQGLKESYPVGDRIVVDLVETGQTKRSEQVDIWVAIGIPTGELIFITSSSSTQAPFKNSVDSSETIHRLLDTEVSPFMIGKYMLYALYVEKGQNPLTEEDGLNVWRSNLVAKEVILGKIK